VENIAVEDFARGDVAREDSFLATWTT